MNPRFSLNANYTFGKGEGDTDGAGSFPSESYNLGTEFGRASTDVRHRFTLAGNIETRWGLSFSPLFGLSNSLAQFTPLGTGGGAATSNRSVALRAQFNF